MKKGIACISSAEKTLHYASESLVQFIQDRKAWLDYLITWHNMQSSKKSPNASLDILAVDIGLYAVKQRISKCFFGLYSVKQTIAKCFFGFACSWYETSCEEVLNVLSIAIGKMCITAVKQHLIAINQFNYRM